jgi:hypothetical protein
MYLIWRGRPGFLSSTRSRMKLTYRLINVSVKRLTVESDSEPTIRFIREPKTNQGVEREECITNPGSSERYYEQGCPTIEQNISLIIPIPRSVNVFGQTECGTCHDHTSRFENKELKCWCRQVYRPFPGILVRRLADPRDPVVVGRLGIVVSTPHIIT